MERNIGHSAEQMHLKFKTRMKLAWTENQWKDQNAALAQKNAEDKRNACGYRSFNWFSFHMS